ncbi:MAG: hypothetical protein K0V04_00020 [Deltaproteobacteria bacterium]|nr:hypothetical protein [Deltaproteobacteria bacterium]
MAPDPRFTMLPHLRPPVAHGRSHRLVPAAVGLLFAMTLGCDSSGPSIKDALAAKPEDDIKTNPPKPRPKDKYGKPSSAEFKAWDRKDPEGEKHLYKWDKANMGRLMGYWEQVTCFRDKMKEEGQKAFGAEPGSPQGEEWFQFKRGFIQHIDGWQKRLFAAEPRINEKSKYIGHFLEAHELVMREYPAAFNESDQTALDEADAHWMIVEAKVKKYTKTIGGEFPVLDTDNAKQVEAHAKRCAEAMKPPDRSGKSKRRRKSKSPI